MLAPMINYFFPDVKKEETRMFGLLAITGFFVIGTYWLLRLLKNTIFYTVAFPVELGWPAQQGTAFQPLAKVISPFVVLAVVLIYSKLIDMFKKHQLFYIICFFYGTLFAIIGSIIAIKDVYGAQVLGREVLAITGWFSYFAVESFGSLLPALFWSFTNSISTTDAAKRGFPLIVTFMQIGAIGGSALLLVTEHVGSLSPFVCAASLLTFAVAGMMHYFMSTIPASQMVGNPTAAATEKKKEGFFEGFYSGILLLVTRPYLLSVFVVSTFYEIASQIIDFQMHAQANRIYTATEFSWFEGVFGVLSNGLSFMIALLGTSYIVKRFGIRVSLMIYPVLFAITIAALLLFFLYGAPTTAQLLWATLASFMIIKSVGYAVNNPLKEMMYIPTSKDAKFKSKGWTDMFGGRIAKGTGGYINGWFKHDPAMLMVYGTFISFGIIGVWMAAALYLGRKNQKLIASGEIIE
ncbi:MAG TPA: Npt1/Npt2 family nucleotide transporter [Candidatus Babeliales bacterium]|nr:Npt1/Npt2 family nucleotide transporter [Candidatus Babeliales bacterium]